MALFRKMRPLFSPRTQIGCISDAISGKIILEIKPGGNYVVWLCILIMFSPYKILHNFPVGFSSKNYALGTCNPGLFCLK